MADYPYNTKAWRVLRAAHLARSPMCTACDEAGRLTLANTVDHVHAISMGGPAFPGHDGLNSLCASCHSAKTARGPEAGAVRSTRPVQPRKGCDANGNPTDPSHPWNEKKSLRADRTGTAVPPNTELVSKDRRYGR